MSDSKVLTYKDKPLIRRGNMVYYGNPNDKYIILMMVNKTKKVGELEVASSISIQLQTNEQGSGKVIKKAEREGFYAAMDIAEYWLTDALENH